MESAKSRQHREKRDTHVRRKHSNKQFYNSKAWKDVRKAYLDRYREALYSQVPLGSWNGIDISEAQQSYILSLPFLPCETCLRFYCADAYDTVDPGKELDHIKPVNRENAMESKEHGDPFDMNNLQYLCKRHHSKKSQRERS